MSVSLVESVQSTGRCIAAIDSSEEACVFMKHFATLAFGKAKERGCIDTHCAFSMSVDLAYCMVVWISACSKGQ